MVRWWLRTGAGKLTTQVGDEDSPNLPRAVGRPCWRRGFGGSRNRTAQSVSGTAQKLFSDFLVFSPRKTGIVRSNKVDARESTGRTGMERESKGHPVTCGGTGDWSVSDGFMRHLHVGGRRLAEAKGPKT